MTTKVHLHWEQTFKFTTQAALIAFADKNNIYKEPAILSIDFVWNIIELFPPADK